MTRRFGVAVWLGLALSLLAAPTVSAGGRSGGLGDRVHRGGVAGVGRIGGGPVSHFHGHSFHRHGGFFDHRDHLHRRFFPPHFVGIVAGPSAVVYAPPQIVYAPPVYYVSPPPQVSYPPQMVYPPPPAPSAPPVPRVVEYPTGRYELRGDGVTTPYTWAWIPNPPPPPPPPPPSEAPPEGPSSTRAARPRTTQVYRWADEHGVVHWTDRLEAVPERYREAAKRFGPS